MMPDVVWFFDCRFLVWLQTLATNFSRDVVVVSNIDLQNYALWASYNWMRMSLIIQQNFVADSVRSFEGRFCH